jgi:hypothetical protein
MWQPTLRLIEEPTLRSITPHWRCHIVSPVDKAHHSVRAVKKGATVQVRDEMEARDISGAPSVPPEQSTTSGFKLWIGLGIVFAMIAVFFLPPLFGGLGILVGYLARRRGSQVGGVFTMYISGTAMVLGMALGVLLHFIA